MQRDLQRAANISTHDRRVQAFGFALFDHDTVNPASNLASSPAGGVYCSCCANFCCFFLPIPGLFCRRFTAVDDNALQLVDGCCLPRDRTFKRNWDENQRPGPPNSFSNSGGETFEFGAANGFCTGGDERDGACFDGICYLRVC